MFSDVMDMMDGEIEGRTNQFHLANRLAEFRVPMFWLSPDIAQALKLTEPPGKLDWYNLKMPFEAGVFMMPKGSLKHPIEGDVSYIAYVRFRGSVEYGSPLIPWRQARDGEFVPFKYKMGDDGIFLQVQCEDTRNFFGWPLLVSDYGDLLTLSELQQQTERVLKRAAGLRPGDSQLLQDVAHYLFSTVMLITARPDLITPASLDSRVRAKKGNQVKEFWNPCVIGKHYKIRRTPNPPQGGAHASPRFHWVRGFWREQPYGPRHELRKSQWVEPFTRGGDKEE
jgi:hypothetical protein